MKENKGTIVLLPGAEGVKALAIRAVLAASRFKKCRRVMLPTFPWNKDLFIGNKLLILHNFIRHFACARNVFALKNNFSSRRKFSIISVHMSFTVSLYRFQPRCNSGLFDYKQNNNIKDRLKILINKLIYSKVFKDVPY